MSKVMKTFGKRGLTLLLALIMSFSLIVPTSMAAEDETDVNDDVITVESEDEVEEGTVVDEEVVYENAIVPLTAVEDDDLANEPQMLASLTNGDYTAFVIFSEDDYSLNFYADTYVPEEGSMYDGKTVDIVFTEFYDNVNSYQSWENVSSLIITVTIDESFSIIQPSSLVRWFYDFSNCTEIIGLEYLDTTNVTSMYETFRNCSSLENLDLSGWDVQSVTNMNGMFANCSNVNTIILGYWNTANVLQFSEMFYCCQNLVTIYAYDFDTSKTDDDSIYGYNSNMFYGCDLLIGGYGTIYNRAKVKSEYARVDSAQQKGYFSDPSNMTQQELKVIESGKNTTINPGSTWVEFTPTITGLYYFYYENWSNDCYMFVFFPTQRDNEQYTYYTYDTNNSSMTKIDGYTSGQTYYLLIANSSGEGIEINVTNSPETINLNEEYSSNNFYTYNIYKYTAEENGYYTFDSNSNTCFGRYYPYWSEDYNRYIPASNMYYTDSYQKMIVYLEEGQTYYFVVYNYNENSNYCAKLIKGVEASGNTINYFDKTANKKSLGTGEEVDFAIIAQVIYQDIEVAEWKQAAIQESLPYGWSSDNIILTFHDTLNDSLDLENESFKLTYFRGNDSDDTFEEIEVPQYPDYYDGEVPLYFIESADDGCTFDISINLTGLYYTPIDGNEDDYYIYDIDELQYSYFQITYDATLSEDATPGEYDNPAYAEYSFGYDSTTSDIADAEVTTYGLVVYKYDGIEKPSVLSYQPDWYAYPDCLSGAIFNVYDADMNYIETIETDEFGTAITSTTFADGTHLILQEIQAPNGYILDETPIDVYIDGSDSKNVSEYWYWVNVANYADTHEVVFYKYGTEGDDILDIPLEGAEFVLSRVNDGAAEYAVADFYFDGWDNYYTITEWTNNASSATALVTDGYGVFDITNIETGSYTMTETKAPKGYIELDEGVEFTVDSDGYVTVTSDNAAADYDWLPWVYIDIGNDPVSTAFDVNKTDMDGSPLKGAEFVLGVFQQYIPMIQSINPDINSYTVTSDGKYVYFYLIFEYDDVSETYTYDTFNWPYTESIDDSTKLTTNSDGSISIDGLPLSDPYGYGYFLIETKAPEGYDLLEDPIVFSINDDGTIRLWLYDTTHVSTDGKSITVIDESSTHDFYLDKVAEDGTPLDGAIFHLSDTDGDLYFVESDGTYTLASSDTDGASTNITAGSVHIDGLPSGLYTLTEIQAPDGYSLLSDSIQFTIADNGTLTLYVENSNVSIDGMTMTVTNSVSSPMPETGSIGTWLVYTIGLAAIAGTGVILYSRKRRLA